ncbi:MAG: hypothetical protein IJ285_00875 [Clostridia bacterium]|nr:hypothetical protein [Clostridia bacterium]
MAFSWKRFWQNIKGLGSDDEQTTKQKTEVLAWDDIEVQNPLDVVVKKLGTLVNDEATFELESDSSLVDPLRVLCEDLEKKRYKICAMMMGQGNCFVTMATNEDSEPYHRILPREDVSIYKESAGKIYELAMIIDRKTIKRQKYTLVRRHYLDENGTLFVYYYSLDDSGKEMIVEEWEHFKKDNTAFYNANHIGVAHFKSPQDSNGLEPFFGVPLNFACKEEEERLIKATKMRFAEMETARMKLFADESIVLNAPDENGRKRHDIPEDIYTIRKRAGVDGVLIEEFAPSTRYTDFRQNEIDAGYDYEDRIGLNPGFVTPAEHTAGATATEIRTANAKTISMMNKVRAAMYDGIMEVLKADNIFLLLPLDLWTLKVDWYDPFENPSEQWQRLLEGKNAGVAEDEDLALFLFPDLTLKERIEKIERIRANKAADTASTIDRMFAGEI